MKLLLALKGADEQAAITGLLQVWLAWRGGLLLVAEGGSLRILGIQLLAQHALTHRMTGSRREKHSLLYVLVVGACYRLVMPPVCRPLWALRKFWCWLCTART